MFQSKNNTDIQSYAHCFEIITMFVYLIFRLCVQYTTTKVNKLNVCSNANLVARLLRIQCDASDVHLCNSSIERSFVCIHGIVLDMDNMRFVYNTKETNTNENESVH